MDTIKRTHKQQKPYNSKIYSDYFGGLKVAILDIETTGLNPKYSKVILGGLLIPGESVLAVTQYFANNKNEEKELLQAYCTALSKADVLISYNGCSFDIPFLKSRLMYHGLDIDIESNQCFDLYRALHFYSRFRDFLPNLKQKTVEAYLGIAESRNDGISGRESVPYMMNT